MSRAGRFVRFFRNGRMHRAVIYIMYVHYILSCREGARAGRPAAADARSASRRVRDAPGSAGDRRAAPPASLHPAAGVHLEELLEEVLVVALHQYVVVAQGVLEEIVGGRVQADAHLRAAEVDV